VDDLNGPNDVVVQFVKVICGNPILCVLGCADPVRLVSVHEGLAYAEARDVAAWPLAASRVFHVRAISRAYCSLVTG